MLFCEVGVRFWDLGSRLWYIATQLHSCAPTYAHSDMHVLPEITD